MSQMVEINQRDNIATVTLNRPQVHNAFNEEVIEALITAFTDLEQDPNCRVMVLASKGKSFSAGADLNWMKKMADYTEQENRQDASRLALMLSKLYNFSKPTIARVQGSAFGGAIGLIACCDIAIASRLSKFCLSEVKIGLIPATIAPYVVEAVGSRMASRLFMTAEVFSSRRARRIGLISEVVSEEDLETEVNNIAAQILKNAPLAVVKSKQLVRDLAHKPIDSSLIDMTCERIAEVRVSDEGQEGLNAFLQKRAANWVQNGK